MRRSLHFSVSFPFLFLFFLCCPYFGTFLSMWSTVYLIHHSRFSIYHMYGHCSSSNHIIPLYCQLSVSCRSLNWCGFLRSCKPQIWFFFMTVVVSAISLLISCPTRFQIMNVGCCCCWCYRCCHTHSPRHHAWVYLPSVWNCIPNRSPVQRIARYKHLLNLIPSKMTPTKPLHYL